MMLRRALAGPCAVLAIALIAGCATPAPQMKDLGDGAYSLTERSGLMSLRFNDLKAKVEMKAAVFCKERGKALTLYDTRVVDPDPPEFASATVQFRCVAP